MLYLFLYLLIGFVVISAFTVFDRTFRLELTRLNGSYTSSELIGLVWTILVIFWPLVIAWAIGFTAVEKLGGFIKKMVDKDNTPKKRDV